MNKSTLTAGVAVVALFAAASASLAQSNPSAGGNSPAAELDGAAGGASGSFSGYVPSANPRGMSNGGSGVVKTSEPAAPAVDAAGKTIPDMSNGSTVTADKMEGFNEAIEQNFPMTPDMIRRYREIFDENQRALLERDEPDARVDSAFISLEPGETPPTVVLAPGIATVIGFYDVTGAPWPVTQFIAGAGEDYQVIQLGEESANLAMTPLKKLGFTNLVVKLKDEPRPVVVRIQVSDTAVNYRRDIQVMSHGPNAKMNTAVNDSSVTEAGSEMLLAFLAGVDIPSEARRVPIQGVDARGWLMGDKVYLRSKHPLMWPAHSSAMSGPDGVRVYEIPRSFTALFSVDGQMIRADVVLP